MNLDIYLRGELIARTAERSRGKKFTIEYLDPVTTAYADESIVLSCSLPTPGPSGPGAARAFLEGLLTEGEALTAMAARVRGVRLDSDISPSEPGDVLALLAEYGRECAGAVVTVPAGNPAPADGYYRRIEDDEIAQRIASLPQRPLGVDADADIRMSLAGNQPKLLLAEFDGVWFEPIAGAASTHIVKPAASWPASADNEALVMTLARHVGLTPMPSRVETFGNTRALITQRFDRVAECASRSVQRLHQEDMCQALSMRPKEKYLIGRPSKRMGRLLRRIPVASRSETETLFRQVAFRAIVGDEDGHGKNYALLINGGEAAVAPIYDCLCTQVYPALSGKMAAPVGPQQSLVNVDRDALVSEGVALGLSTDKAGAVVATLAERILAAVAQLPGDPFVAEVFDAVTRTVCARAERVLLGQPMGAPPAHLR